jgi:hypothetical protein
MFNELFSPVLSVNSLQHLPLSFTFSLLRLIRYFTPCLTQQTFSLIYSTFFIPVASNSNFYIRHIAFTLVLDLLLYSPPSGMASKSERDPSSCLQSGRGDFYSPPLLPFFTQKESQHRLHKNPWKNCFIVGNRNMVPCQLLT